MSVTSAARSALHVQGDEGWMLSMCRTGPYRVRGPVVLKGCTCLSKDARLTVDSKQPSPLTHGSSRNTTWSTYVANSSLFLKKGGVYLGPSLHFIAKHVSCPLGPRPAGGPSSLPSTALSHSFVPPSPFPRLPVRTGVLLGVVSRPAAPSLAVVLARRSDRAEVEVLPHEDGVEGESDVVLHLDCG